MPQKKQPPRAPEEKADNPTQRWQDHAEIFKRMRRVLNELKAPEQSRELQYAVTYLAELQKQRARGEAARAGEAGFEAAVLSRAVEVIGDREQAMRWLGTPVRALEYATPISRLHNEAGAKDVMDLLAALEQGAW